MDELLVVAKVKIVGRKLEIVNTNIIDCQYSANLYLELIIDEEEPTPFKNMLLKATCRVDENILVQCPMVDKNDRKYVLLTDKVFKTDGIKYLSIGAINENKVVITSNVIELTVSESNPIIANTTPIEEYWEIEVKNAIEHWYYIDIEPILDGNKEAIKLLTDEAKKQQTKVTTQQQKIDSTITVIENKLTNGEFTPKFSVGTVSQSATPNVSITGPSNKPVLNFGLVKGDKGDKGDTGIQGIKGDKGDKGDTGSIGNVTASDVKTSDNQTVQTKLDAIFNTTWISATRILDRAITSVKIALASITNDHIVNATISKEKLNTALQTQLNNTPVTLFTDSNPSVTYDKTITLSDNMYNYARLLFVLEENIACEWRIINNAVYQINSCLAFRNAACVFVTFDTTTKVLKIASAMWINQGENTGTKLYKVIGYKY